MPLKKFENPQIKNYIKYWENECRTSSFSFFLDQSQHNTQQAVIKSNKTKDLQNVYMIKEENRRYDIFKHWIFDIQVKLLSAS